MKLGIKTSTFLFFFILSLIQTIKAWEKLDFEIFELWDSIKKKDQTTNWYELLGVKDSASLDEINRAFRNLGRKYHPDKLKGSATTNKEATDKFARLGLVANILRDSYKRKRYNFFKKNGVPIWRGTGYLYSRWRPGAGTVIVGILIVSSLFQYLFATLSYWRAQQRIEELERDSKPEKDSNSNRNRGGFDEPEDMEYIPGSINPYLVEPASFHNLLLVKIVSFFIYKAKVLMGVQTLQDESGNIGKTMLSEQSKESTPSLPAKYSKLNKNGLSPNNASDSTTDMASVATSDTEFNAMVIEKSSVEAAMSQDSQNLAASTSTKKKIIKKRRAPVV
ncbi:hypothetical protein BB561_003901 [Smittium simulii]|uniref:J domain-containing protein n=1 Tax=Smittium simulii TaxID=133385 RepID=A0A2T9YJ11_9FUNG|nr:hypothetical protein BB561_003901 [Smittium simulii]